MGEMLGPDFVRRETLVEQPGNQFRTFLARIALQAVKKSQLVNVPLQWSPCYRQPPVCG